MRASDRESFAHHRLGQAQQRRVPAEHVQRLPDQPADRVLAQIVDELAPDGAADVVHDRRIEPGAAEPLGEGLHLRRDLAIGLPENEPVAAGCAVRDGPGIADRGRRIDDAADDAGTLQHRCEPALRIEEGQVGQGGPHRRPAGGRAHTTRECRWWANTTSVPGFSNGAMPAATEAMLQALTATSTTSCGPSARASSLARTWATSVLPPAASRRPCVRMLSRWAPRASTLTSLPVRQSRAATSPPIEPAPNMQICIGVPFFASLAITSVALFRPVRRRG